MKPRLTAYIPNRPTKKQRAALCLNHVREIFYGGALGSGKSDWLLMEALQYVDIPDYHVLILRKTLADARKASSIMFRAAQWLTNTDAKRDGNSWLFPTWRGDYSSVLEFGSIANRGDEFSFDGSEYSMIAVDEFAKVNYQRANYVMSTRLRKPGCNIHKDVRVEDCEYCRPYMHTNMFPLRLRTASNPGGESHMQVKNRYKIERSEGKFGPMGYPLYQGTNPARPHIPAFIHDNPYLDADDYIRQLEADLGDDGEDPVTLQRMLAGDWGITPHSRFRRDWIRRWHYQGLHFVNCGQGKYFDLDDCYEMIVCDPASSTKDTPGRTVLDANDKSSWTVVSRWMVTPDNDLLLMNVRRFRKEMPDIIPEIKQEMVAAKGKVRFVGMEFTTQSTYLYQHCTRQGLPMKAFTTGGRDKVARAFDATTRMKNGQIFLPKTRTKWLSEYEDEVFTWTGEKHETDDQVDVTSYAAIHVTQNAAMTGGSVPMLA